MKTQLFLFALCLLTACGDGDAAREAEARAEIDSIRPDYEAREASIEAALKKAHELRGKADLPAVDWGSRPAPKFLDVRYDKLNREADGHIFELAKDGRLNTDPETLLGLFVDTSWRDDIAEKMAGQGYLTKGGVDAAFHSFGQVRFLCLLITDELQDAKLGTGILFTVDFVPGHWKGRALYFDLEGGELIGAKPIDVLNSSSIEFKTEGFSEEEQRKRGTEAAAEDLRKQILAAASTP